MQLTGDSLLYFRRRGFAFPMSRTIGCHCMFILKWMSKHYFAIKLINNLLRFRWSSRRSRRDVRLHCLDSASNSSSMSTSMSSHIDNTSSMLKTLRGWLILLLLSEWMNEYQQPESTQWQQAMLTMPTLLQSGIWSQKCFLWIDHFLGKVHVLSCSI